jgi:hypothetical protein
MAIIFKRATTDNDLIQILELQSKYHFGNISDEEKNNEGFLTAKHSFNQLKQINDAENAIIAVDNKKIIAYAIAMRKDACPSDMLVFKDLFETLESLEYKNQKLSNFKMILVGQLCVDKEFRGMGVVPSLYKKFFECLKEKYDIAVTDISELNPRSLKAHIKSGFEVIHCFFDNYTQTNWNVVLKELKPL